MGEARFKRRWKVVGFCEEPPEVGLYPLTDGQAYVVRGQIDTRRSL